MAERVKLVQGRVRLEKEEPKKISTRVRLEESVISSRVRLNSAKVGRVKLNKTVAGRVKYHYSSTHPHLHTRIVAETERPGETVRWVPMRQDDGKVLYDRIVEKRDLGMSRMILDGASPYGLAASYKKFQGVSNSWVPAFLKSSGHPGWR